MPNNNPNKKTQKTTTSAINESIRPSSASSRNNNNINNNINNNNINNNNNNISNRVKSAPANNAKLALTKFLKSNMAAANYDNNDFNNDNENNDVNNLIVENNFLKQVVFDANVLAAKQQQQQPPMHLQQLLKNSFQHHSQYYHLDFQKQQHHHHQQQQQQRSLQQNDPELQHSPSYMKARESASAAFSEPTYSIDEDNLNDLALRNSSCSNLFTYSDYNNINNNIVSNINNNKNYKNNGKNENFNVNNNNNSGNKICNMFSGNNIWSNNEENKFLNNSLIANNANNNNGSFVDSNNNIHNKLVSSKNKNIHNAISKYNFNNNINDIINNNNNNINDIINNNNINYPLDSTFPPFNYPLLTSSLNFSRNYSAGSANKHRERELDQVSMANKATMIVERLSDENKLLRRELENYYRKINTLEKVEKEIERMGRAYENLVEHTERRECLERMVRMKLESEVVRLNEDNRDFKDQLHQCLSQLHQLNDSMTSLNASSSLSSPAASPLTSSLELQQKELQKKDVVLMKLLKQNRCLLNAKNELEYEASLLRGSLEEQKKQMTFMQLSLSRLQQQQFLNELKSSPFRPNNNQQQ